MIIVRVSLLQDMDPYFSLHILNHKYHLAFLNRSSRIHYSKQSAVAIILESAITLSLRHI